MSTHTRMGLLLAGVALLVGGCQRAAQQPAAPAATPADERVVTVVAKEFVFEPKDIRVKPGIVTFRVRNEGTVEHEFMIERVTAHGEHTSETFAPGVTHEVEVELGPGMYSVSCNVAGHREAGMVGSIIVE